eukprot:7983701-Pyramimonas_sp.AAC.1
MLSVTVKVLETTRLHLVTVFLPSTIMAFSGSPAAPAPRARPPPRPPRRLPLGPPVPRPPPPRASPPSAAPPSVSFWGCASSASGVSSSSSSSCPFDRAPYIPRPPPSAPFASILEEDGEVAEEAARGRSAIRSSMRMMIR